MNPNKSRQFVGQVILLVALEFIVLGLILWSMTVKF